MSTKVLSKYLSCLSSLLNAHDQGHQGVCVFVGVYVSACMRALHAFVCMCVYVCELVAPLSDHLYGPF